MRSVMMTVSSPSVSLCSIRPFRGYVGRWDSWNYCGSISWLKVQQPFRGLPTKTNGMRPAQDGRSVGIVAFAAAPVRWNLDDVERISRGRPSKAKMGSRAVPHRLNAEERKAFELAKKRGYVVQQANSRRYPLINTYRNYCDALDLLCICIEQGTTGFTDQVVIDFTPLHLSKADLSTLRTEISKAIKSISAGDNDLPATFREVPEVDEEAVCTKDPDDSCPLGTRKESGLPDLSAEYLNETLFSDGLEGGSEPLRFQASNRNMTKVISQTALDTWRTFSGNKARN